MQVTFKLFATLMPYLPDGAMKNAVQLSIEPDTTIYQLLDRYRVPRDQVHLVLLNGKFQAEQDRDNVLSEGDTLAIWPPVAGG
jgi:molybdopterin synthase sulfur carrier subunit